MTVTIDSAIGQQREFTLLNWRENYVDSLLKENYKRLESLPDNAYGEMKALSDSIRNLQQLKHELHWKIRNSTCPKTGKKHEWRRDVLQDPRDIRRSCNDPQYLICDDCRNQYFL